MSRSTPNIFTIAPGLPFLQTFVEELQAGRIIPALSAAAGPLALARATIYVPTRRAGRALAAEFERLSPHHAILLPRIAPLGGLDAENDALTQSLGDDLGSATIVPDAIGPLQRRLLLCELVLAWTKALRFAPHSFDGDGNVTVQSQELLVVGATPADAFALAYSLGALIDEFIIEGIDPKRLSELSHETLDEYWALTTRFLTIAFETWPAVLQESGKVDAAQQRALLIEREIMRLEATPESDPVIVLGSTGTNRTTARLMAAIARQSQGALVLPGLDLDLDQRAWSLIADARLDDPGFGHPQAALKNLLAILEIEREDVQALGTSSPDAHARNAFVSAALLPAVATDHWPQFRATSDALIDTGLRAIDVIVAAHEREEALAIAIRLREVLELPDATAALITPDRGLAQRVRAELRRWNIEADDSAGTPLASAPAGILACMLTGAAERGCSDLDRVALLAHPLVTLGLKRSDVERRAAITEIGVLRAGHTRGATAAERVAESQRLALDRHAHPARKQIHAQQWLDAQDILARLDDALAPLLDMPATESLANWTSAHRESLTRLMRLREPEVALLDTSDDLAALESLLNHLIEAASAPSSLQLHAGEYRIMFDGLVREAVLREHGRTHPRIKILGLLEARLLDADLIVLGGLDETVWPPQARTDAFLNRPMRATLGLSPPERRIGQTAHDFVMGLGARNIVITRALKRDGSPTVASRFVQRMAALAGVHWTACIGRGLHWLTLARALDEPDRVVPVARPMPTPPLVVRPQRLSVTRIETLRRDPYAIYASMILNLQPLEPLDDEPGASDQGTALHAALAAFVQTFPDALPEDARAWLIGRAHIELEAHFEDPAFAAFRWPRIKSGIDYFLDFEHERRPLLATIKPETSGRMDFTLADGSLFRLSAQADRIEIGHDGNAAIVDYKTGQVPTDPVVKIGLAPQLTLSALIAGHGGFKDVGPRIITELFYLKLGAKDGGKTHRVLVKENLADITAQHHARLIELLNLYRIPAQGYASRPMVQYASRFGDYDHLARVKEWSSASGDEGGAS